MPIGSWDNSNCVYALVPRAEEAFRTSDLSSGYANIYNGPASGSSVTATMTNMSSGEGYIFSSGNTHYSFNGVDNYIETNTTPFPLLTNTSTHTYVAWLKSDDDSATKAIMSTEDGTKRFIPVVGWRQSVNHYPMSVYDNGPSTDAVRTDVPLDVDELHMYTFIKNSEDLTIYKDDDIEGGYFLKNDYELGDITYTTNMNFGKALAATYGYYSGEIHGMQVYDIAFSESGIDALYALGPGLGDLVGTDNEDGTMGLVVSGDFTTYALTVVSGTGDGNYISGSVNEIVADSPASGYVFNVWTGDTEYVTDTGASTTDVTMPAEAQTVTATYSPSYVLNVISGTGDGNYASGSVVEIVADVVSGGIFDVWTGDTEYLDNASNSTTNVAMPSGAVNVTATYEFWDETGCVWALLPKCEASFRTSDENIGEANIYNGPASGSTVTATLSASSGLGYIYNGGDAYYDFDGNGDVVTFDFKPSFSNTSDQTIVVWMKPDSTGRTVIGTRADNGDVVFAFTTLSSWVNGVFGAPVPTYDYVISNGGVVDTGSSNMYVVHKSGSTLTIYKNAIDVTDTSDAYTLGTHTTDTNLQIGAVESLPSAEHYEGQISAIIYYDKALSQAELTTLYELGEDLGGLVGTDNGDGTMDLSVVSLPTYELTVVSGTGDGNYVSGTVVDIAADSPASGYAFNVWTGDTEYVGNVSGSSTDVTMPSEAVSVTATYVEIPTYALTVISGTGDGSYESGSVNEIIADSPAAHKVFDVWTGDTTYLDSVSSSTTNITMPGETQTVTATYVDVDYTLTVISGTGDGGYSGDTVIEIVADANPSGGSFNTWVGDVAYLANSGASTTDVTMPYANMSVQATYLFPLTVVSGTGDGNYSSGSVNEVVADAPASGVSFNVWIGDTEYLDNASSSTTNVTMPASSVDIEATYSSLPTYTLTVVSGTGDGSYISGSINEIVADAPASGYAFNLWTGDTEYLDSTTESTTNVTMPSGSVTVTATYAVEGTITLDFTGATLKGDAPLQVAFTPTVRVI